LIAAIVTGTGRWKVSAKIQQLLNTLKRPKRRPLPEFYEDDDIELEIAANPKDPNAPKPEGSSMTSAIGEQLVVCTAHTCWSFRDIREITRRHTLSK
jgi:hypothetical protein